MSTSRDDASETGGNGEPKPKRPRQMRVGTLLALVACCGAILWAWRNVSENGDPVANDARAIQKRAITLLHSDKPADRVTAIQDLDRLAFGDGSVSIPPLIGALEDPAPSVRIAAAGAIASIGSQVGKKGSDGEANKAATTALMRSLNDSDPTVRAAAARALGVLGSSLLKSRAAGTTLRDSAPALISSLKDPDPGVRGAAAIALGEIILPAADKVTKYPADRGAVLRALLETLDDPEPRVRRASITAMTAHQWGRNDPPRELARAFKDESAENRAAAANGLMLFRQGLDPWAPLLFRMAEDDPDPKVRSECCRALGHAFRPPAISAAVVPLLCEKLRSKDADVRSQAAMLASGLRGDAVATIPELLRVLNEPPDTEVASRKGPSATPDPANQAAWALGRVAPGSAKAKEVIAALTETVKSGPPSRQGPAAFSLGEFGVESRDAIPALIKMISETPRDGNFDRVASVIMALGKIAPDTPSADQVVAVLLPLLDSRQWTIQSQAIEAVGLFGPKAAAAIPKLRTLKKKDDALLRNAATKALVALGEDKTP